MTQTEPRNAQVGAQRTPRRAVRGPACGRSTPWSTARPRRPEAFRALDQEQVDAIVDAMVRAGIRAAGELAALAIEETGFGVFEDKVVKNYIATEFLSDYLRDKRSVGVIEEDVEHNIVRVAEPIGVVLAITPVTNPTSTVLYKAIVAAKTRNAIIFRPSPYAARSLRAQRRDPPRGGRGGRDAARRAAGDPGQRARGDPLPVQAPAGGLHLGHRRAEDRGARQRRRQARAERRARATRRSTSTRRADLRGRRRRHPDLQDVRRLGDLPGRADLHRRHRGVRRDGRRVRSGWARTC